MDFEAVITYYILDSFSLSSDCFYIYTFAIFGSNFLRLKFLIFVKTCVNNSTNST